jgi:hypothetical protein
MPLTQVRIIATELRIQVDDFTVADDKVEKRASSGQDDDETDVAHREEIAHQASQER